MQTAGFIEQKSKALYERAQQAIPGGVNSPVRAFRSVGGTPIFMRSGEGCYLTDEDGNRYIDFCNSWGPLIHGHRHPRIVEALREQMDRALTFGTPNEHEVRLAEEIVARVGAKVPTLQQVRFVNSGTEAVMSALRLARGFTNRDKILKFEGSYHGHVDSMLVQAGSGLATAGVPDSAGVPAAFTRDTIVIPLDDDAALEQAFADHGPELAAAIVEPVPANNGLLLQRKEFLEKLRALCTQHGALLIFDEVISGFRVSFAGASGEYEIAPDLITYGKIVGGGMPVGAFAGRREILALLAPDGPVYQAGTLAGNPLAMVAGLAQLQLLDDAVYAKLNLLGEAMANEFNSWNLDWKLRRMHSIFWIHKDSETGPPRRPNQIAPESKAVYARLHRFCLERGVYLAPSAFEVGFLSVPMESAETERLLICFREFFQAN